MIKCEYLEKWMRKWHRILHVHKWILIDGDMDSIARDPKLVVSMESKVIMLLKTIYMWRHSFENIHFLKKTKFYTHTHTHTYVCIYFNLHKNTTSQSKFASHLVDDKGFEKILISLGHGLQTIYRDHAKSYIIFFFSWPLVASWPLV